MHDGRMEPVFRTDLYRGTAAFYDEFRRPYPAALIDDLLDRVGADGKGRLLDLACGPGTVTFAVSDRFAEVVAVDQEPDAIEHATAKAARVGVGNVQWIVGRAEAVDPGERFDVVTIGTAFHRLDRPRVADLAMRALRAGGHLALLWSPTPLLGPEPWHPVVAEVVFAWMARADPDERLPADLRQRLVDAPHEAVLEAAGFEVLGHHEFPVELEWTIDELIGFVYSTSLLPRALLGDQASAFEADLRARVVAVEPSGVCREDASFAYDLAMRSR